MDEPRILRGKVGETWSVSKMILLLIPGMDVWKSICTIAEIEDLGR